jgi:hypothetical protein
VTVLLSWPLDGHLRTEISATNFSFTLSPNSPKYDDIIVADSLSKVTAPPSLLPLCLKTVLTPFTDRPPSTPASLQSQDRPYTIHRPTALNTGFLAVSRVFLCRSRTVLSSMPIFLYPQESRMSFNLKISLIRSTSRFSSSEQALQLHCLSSLKYNRHPHFYWGWRSYFELDR